MKKRPVLERVGDFMEGRGFYIVLFLCVAAIGISGYYLFSALNPGESNIPVTGPAQVTVQVPVQSQQPVIEPVKPSVPVVQPEKVTPSAPQQVETIVTPELELPPAPPVVAPTFAWPVKGEVIADFSLEVLAFDETMGDWRVHCGWDISAPVGTQVLAISAGTVAAIEEHPLMGTTVTIAHADGVESVYANLAATPTVEVGDQVEIGAVIGAVGETAVAESARAPHLHFEMREEGESVDPVRYLPEA